MIEPTMAAIGAVATTGGARASASRTAVTSSGGGFAGELAKKISASAASTSASTSATGSPSATATTVPPTPTPPTATTKPPARPDGEQTKRVAGHPFARIENGHDKGLYLNLADGNPRQGAAFRLVEHGDQVFHVYGTGKDKVIIGMTPKTGAAAAPSAATSGGTTPTATATPTTKT